MLMKGQIHPPRGDYLAYESGERGSCLQGWGGGAHVWLRMQELGLLKKVNGRIGCRFGFMG